MMVPGWDEVERWRLAQPPERSETMPE